MVANLAWYVAISGDAGGHLPYVDSCIVGFIFKDRKTQGVAPVLTEVTDMNMNKLGNPSDQCFRLKGAKTWGFLLFLVDLFESRGKSLKADDEVRGSTIYEAAKSLVQVALILFRKQREYTPDCAREAVAHYKRFLSLTDGWEDLMTPKRHRLIHCMCMSVSFIWLSSSACCMER